LLGNQTEAAVSGLIVNRRVVALLGGFKFSFELSISLILGLLTNVDLVASRIRISVIAFPAPLRDRHFIQAKLPLREAGSDDGSKACSEAGPLFARY
jgi:hypothetical protein